MATSVSFICPTCDRELKKEDPRELKSDENGRLTYGHVGTCPANRSKTTDTPPVPVDVAIRDASKARNGR